MKLNISAFALLGALLCAGAAYAQSAANAAKSVDLVYKFKAGPYSSHAILMATLPQNGAGKSLLDVGCGDGYLSKILSERGYQVTGLEQRGGYSDRLR